jgi:hypothetical protein
MAFQMKTSGTFQEDHWYTRLIYLIIALGYPTSRSLGRKCGNIPQSKHTILTPSVNVRTPTVKHTILTPSVEQPKSYSFGQTIFTPNSIKSKSKSHYD